MFFFWNTGSSFFGNFKYLLYGIIAYRAFDYAARYFTSSVSQ